MTGAGGKSPEPSTRADHVARIAELIHEYAFRLDRGDLDGVAALFEHAELRSTRHDRVLRGTVAARTLYEPIVLGPDGTPGTMHQLTNVTVFLDDTAEGPASEPTTASARSYFTVLQVTALGLHPILGGEYRDRFALASGRWEFRERVFDPRLFGDLSGHMRG